MKEISALTKTPWLDVIELSISPNIEKKTISNTKYLIAEFETEVKRLQHLKATVIDKFTPRFELTQHNTRAEDTNQLSSSQTEIIREYLLHVLQYGTPEERLKILLESRQNPVSVRES